MEAFSFGSYYAGTSVLHHMDPRTKLLSGFAFLIVALCSHSFAALSVLAAGTVIAYAAAHIPARYALKSIAPLMAFVLLVSVLNLFTDQGGATLFRLGIIQISEGSVYSCCFTACRMFLMMCGMSLVTMTTMTLDLTQAVERLLAPLSRFGFPAHEMGMILGIALRFMPQFATELTQTYQAQVSRGAHVASGPIGSMRFLSSISIPLFASVFRHAETLAAAMDARCYHGEQGRTRLHPLRYTKRDLLALAFIILLAAGVGLVTVLF